MRRGTGKIRRQRPSHGEFSDHDPIRPASLSDGAGCMRRRELLSGLAGPPILVGRFGAAAAAQSSGLPRTATETAVGVTPRDPQIANGPARYGARGDGRADDTAAWRSMGAVNGCHVVPDGTYRITAKVQTSAFLTIIGTTRQNTVLESAGFPDHLLEVGSRDSGPNPNVGSLQRLRFLGGEHNTSLLHMNQLSHMWRLDELLFQSAGCPALIIDNCWDSNFTNIDILSCGTGGDPTAGAAVIVKTGSNNLYFRGLRIEQCPAGALYVGADCGPVYVTTGKIDQGFIAEAAAAVTIAGGAVLCLNDFSITGVAGQFAFDVAGTLLLGNVIVDGGSGRAAINDARRWNHRDPRSVPGISAAACGPALPALNLGSAQFYRSHPSSNQETRAVLHSRVLPLRSVERVVLSANGRDSGDTILVQTDLRRPTNNQFDRSFLVHNPTGTQASGQAGARRKILTSFADGQLLLQGNWPCTVDAEWSVEFCGGHYTPNLGVAGVRLDPGMSLFSILYTGLTIASRPQYQGTAAAVAPGGTRFALSGVPSGALPDAAGYFLVDESSGEPFLISHGIDAALGVAVLYDRVADLSIKTTYSIVAGYAAGIMDTGSTLEWSHGGKRQRAPVAALHRLGFDSFNLPLWGIGADG